MRTAVVALLAACAASLPVASGADFASATATPGNAFSTAADFNTVAVALADPGSPVHGTVTLSATASSERGIASVVVQTAPAGSGAWSDACTMTGPSPYTCSWDSSAVATGTYDLRAVATDAAGYSRTSVAGSRVIANTGPEVTLADPGAYLQGTKTISATATDAGAGVASLAIQYRREGATAWTQLCTGAGTSRACALDTTAEADGDVELRALATDGVGNARATAPLTRRVDNTAPAVATTDPGTMRGTFTLAAAADDGAGSGVASVTAQVRAAGSTTWTTVCTDTTAPYTCSYDTTGVADGQYELRALAVDGTGLVGTGTVLTRRIDNTVPTASTLSDPGTMQGTVTLTGTAGDSGSGVAGWTVQYRPSGGGTWTDACADTTAPWASCTWSTTAVADGTYDLRAVTADAAGNTRTSTTLAARRVDNLGPAVTLADPGAALRGTVTLTATATDPAGVTSVVFERKPSSGSTWTAICTVATAPYSCAWNTTTLGDGIYDLRARATDALAHTSFATVIDRQVDNTAPAPADVQAGNGGATAGRMESGDWVRFTWTEPVAPGSIQAGWNGTAIAVTVRVADGNKRDTLEIDDAAGTTELNVAASRTDLALNADVVGADTVFDATMLQSGSSITVTLGARRSGSVKTATAAAMTWKASPLTSDLAGNPIAAGATVTESGASDADF